MAQGASEHAHSATAKGSQVDDLVVPVLDRKCDVVQVAPGDLHYFTGGQHDVAAIAGNDGIAVHSDIRSHQVDITAA